MKKKSLPTVLSGLAILLLLAPSVSSGSQEGGCSGKGYIDKVCAVTGKSIVDIYEWNGSAMTSHTTREHWAEVVWEVGIRNISSGSLELCFAGSDSEQDGDEYVLEGTTDKTTGNMIAIIEKSVSNFYPDGPPCIYYRPLKQ